MKTVSCTVCSLAVLTWFGGYDVIEASSIPAAAQRSVRVGTSHLVDSLRVLRNQIRPPSEETDQDDLSSDTGDVSYTEPGTHTSLMPRSRNRGGAQVGLSHLSNLLRVLRSQITDASSDDDGDSDSDDHAGA